MGFLNLLFLYSQIQIPENKITFLFSAVSFLTEGKQKGEVVTEAETERLGYIMLRKLLHCNKSATS